jgi:hypothetical protein
MARPWNGLVASNGASGIGAVQDMAPDRVRSPKRSGTGTSGSGLAARIGPAKRIRAPPLSIQRSAAWRSASEDRVPSGTSRAASRSVGWAPPSRSAMLPRRISAKGSSARCR